MSGVGRRDVLRGIAASAGMSAGLSATGCPSSSKTTEPTLSFVGQSAERGHAVRDALRSGGSPAEHIKVGTLIVGGGASGTAAAWRMHRAGYEDFLLVELEDAYGGTAQSGQTTRSAFPMGAHYLPSPHPDFTPLRELLRELDIEIGEDAAGRPEFDPSITCHAPIERHRYRGQWSAGIYPAAGETPQEASQWQRWLAHLHQLDAARDDRGQRLFKLPIEHSSPKLRHLSGISMAAYLDQLGLTSWRTRWSVDYACRDDYGLSLEQTSAFAGLHHYLCRGLESTHDRVTLTWPGGNGELVARMAAAADVNPRRRSGFAVVRIDSTSGECLAWDFAKQHLVAVQAKTVLWAAPRFVLPFVVGAGADPLPRNALTYAPWLVANVSVAARPGGVGSPLAWDNVQIDTPHLGYVVATHNESLQDAKTQSDTVLTFYAARLATAAASLGEQRARLLGATLPELSAEVTGALEGMHPGISQRITAMAFARWGHAMIRPVPGLLFSDHLTLAAAPVGVVIPCATDVGGVPLFEQAYCNGIRGAETALARAGVPTHPLVPSHVG